jgi:hypothetical protein
MNEELKEHSRKAKPVTERIGIWLIVLVVVFAAASGGMAKAGALSNQANWFASLVFVVLCSMVATLVLWLIVRWFGSWRVLRRVLFGLVCLFTIICLFYAEEDWRGKYAWDHFRSKGEAKGEHFDMASVVPPPVPDDQNFAFAPVVASSYSWLIDRHGHEIRPQKTNVVNRLALDETPGTSHALVNVDGWAVATRMDFTGLQNFYRTLAAKTNLFPVPAQPGLPAADVLLALSRFEPAIAELRQAGELPFSRFPLEYERGNPAEILLPHLAALKNSARVLQLRAVAELQTGQSDLALADVKLIHRLADAVRTEPFLISHLVRIANTRFMFQPIWEGLADHRWTEPQLIELEAELARLDFVADYQASLRGETGTRDGILRFLREHPANYNQLFDKIPGDLPRTDFLLAVLMQFDLVPGGWFYQNQLNAARTMEEFYAPVVDLKERTVSPSLAQAGDARVANELQHLEPYNFIASQLTPMMGSAAQKFARIQNDVNLARVAIALERYRLAGGKYPGSLDALAPGFMEAVPHDVIGGGPLHYRLTDDGQFVLYSVGWNEKDDGGVVVLSKGSDSVQNVLQGDWVWHYPAK